MQSTSLMNERNALALVLLLPVTLPVCLLLGWTSRHVVGSVLGLQQVDLGYSLFFAAIPSGIAFLVGGAMALMVPPLVRKSALVTAAVANGLFYLLGIVGYHAPLV
ncbi:hypothetical protein NG895_07735 [Aeoliella sp. ICT_H6.2]|uniref:Uncharacterized protein n=1 Tax=Aeoliella straminimaris TaxID=2954799 RepID=A0A9X2JF88_9BACT|nr:hypothetical protein [Aeoliella straminimaris]MCO6043795.1 hypothetical protein [Aeoliella straminimaris]